MPTTPVRAARRRDWLVWVGLVLALVGVIAATGGFADAIGSRRTAAAGQPVRVTRWTFVVHAAEFTDRSTDGYETEPVVRIRLSVTNTSARSLFAPEKG